MAVRCSDNNWRHNYLPENFGKGKWERFHKNWQNNKMQSRNETIKRTLITNGFCDFDTTKRNLAEFQEKIERSNNINFLHLTNRNYFRIFKYQKAPQINPSFLFKVLEILFEIFFLNVFQVLPILILKY